MIRILLSSLLVLCFGMSAMAQGEIQGKVVDEKGDPVPYCAVIIIDDTEGKRPTGKGARTDNNGFYTIKGLSPGNYNIMAKTLGKSPVIEVGFRVLGGRPNELNFKLGGDNTTLKTIEVTEKRKTAEIMDVFDPKETVIDAAQIAETPSRNMQDFIGTKPGVIQADFGEDLNVAGDRGGGTTYFVDGVKVTGSNSVPPNSVEQMDVMVSGIPAKYGDATAGVISITTKGAAKEWHGGIEALTSKFLDPWGYSLINGNVSGPIVRKKIKYDDGTSIKGRVILGFFLSGEYQHDDDKYPTVNGRYKVKDDKFQELQDVPYILGADGTSILPTANLLVRDDIETIKHHQNTANNSVRMNGKLDWNVNEKGTYIAAGGGINMNEYSKYIPRYSLLNYYNNPKYRNETYRGYLRWYQPLSNSMDTQNRVIRNAAMQLQFDYEQTGEQYKSPIGEFNPWRYGYVGKFTQDYEGKNELIQGKGTDGEKVYYGSGEGDYLEFTQYIRRNEAASGIEFEKGDINPLAASFTEYFINLYESVNGPAKTMSELDNKGALVNGKRADVFINNVFYPMSRISNGIQYEHRDQFRFSGNFNFDVIPKNSTELNKHTIEVGFEAEQRFESRYRLGPNALWYLADNNMNTHLSYDYKNIYNPLLIMKDGTVEMRYQDYVKQLNSDNPIIFGQLDTMYYDYEASNGTQTRFSKLFRQKFGLDSLTRVNVNEYSPEDLDLGFFSADELIASGNTPLSYYGYDYTGKKLPYNVKFQDFFTEKDEYGSYKRNVAARSPLYLAGYVQDRFQLKEIAFNVGLRMDYFNPNTYSFIDPYIPRQGRTIGEVGNSIGGITPPSNLSQDAIVYVDNATNPSKITGYRLGNQWYSSIGEELYGPNSIQTLSGGQVIPYLKGDNAEERAKYDMGSATFNPEYMFKKTAAIFNFMPRLNFTFKIDSNSIIFAHFDRMTRRPDRDANQVNALDYYNLVVRGATGSGNILENADLKSPGTTDLELGFKQKISTRSSVTINFFYREYTNQIGVKQITGGYPSSYIRFDNVDFSTVKGFGLAYELRRVKNLRLQANYTMQFASGTGSSSYSQLNIINAGVGNLKVIAPLNFDVRHNINLDFNYRFADGPNYYGPAGAKGFLKNSGISIISFLRSGTPYTLQSNPREDAFITTTTKAVTFGDINSARMPWGFNVNLKVYKDFKFKFGKKPIDSSENFVDERKSGGITVYLQIRNLLNTFRTLHVYRYTGNAADDGYLNSPLAQLVYDSNEAALTGSGQSFRDLYKLALELPEESNDYPFQVSNYAQPRIIQLGVSFNF